MEAPPAGSSRPERPPIHRSMECRLLACTPTDKGVELLLGDCTADEAAQALNTFFLEIGFSLARGSLREGVYEFGDAVGRLFAGALLKRSKFQVHVLPTDRGISVSIVSGMSGVSGGAIGVDARRETAEADRRRPAGVLRLRATLAVAARPSSSRRFIRRTRRSRPGSARFAHSASPAPPSSAPAAAAPRRRGSSTRDAGGRAMRPAPCTGTIRRPMPGSGTRPTPPDHAVPADGRLHAGTESRHSLLSAPWTRTRSRCWPRPSRSMRLCRGGSGPRR